MSLDSVGGISKLRAMAMTVLNSVFLPRLGLVSAPRSVIAVMVMVVFMIVIVLISTTLALRVKMIMARVRHKINDITHATLPQPRRQSLQRKTRVLKVMQRHADSHNIEVVKIRPGVLLGDTLGEQVSVVRSHPVGESNGLGVAVEFGHHVVGNIEADDFGEIGSQGLPEVSQRAMLFTLVNRHTIEMTPGPQAYSSILISLPLPMFNSLSVQ